MTGAGVPASRLNEVCRILRRRDRPTAHPRHGSMQARLEVHGAIPTDGGGGDEAPKPFPQYLPFTLRYGSLRLRRSRFGRYPSPVKSAGLTSNTFDAIVWTGRMLHFPQVLRAGRDTVILCNTCILTINGRLSRYFSRCRNAYQEGHTTPSYPLPVERAVLVRFSEKFYHFSLY